MRLPSLKRWLWQPIESRKEFLLACVALWLFSTAFSLWSQAWQHGLGKPQPWGEVKPMAWALAVLAPLREESFKGLARGFRCIFACVFGRVGYTIGDIVLVFFILRGSSHTNSTNLRLAIGA
jgi:hypothetical protein